jgi:oligopeptide/dipeptide ABC transporter ATP-binding protein
MLPVLSVKNLTTTVRTPRGEVSLIEEVSFDLQEKETLGIVGESGCGKSITINSIMGLLDAGNTNVSADILRLSGNDLLAMPEKEKCKLRGNEISMIFQDPMTALNPSLKIKYQLVEALKIHTTKLKKEALGIAEATLREAGIADPQRILNNYPHQLSGGLRQRVMIAMAVLCRPKVVLADEPTTALDVTIQAQILELLKKLQDEFGMGLVLVTHDLGVVAENCDRVIVMYCGQIVEEAGVSEIFKDVRHPYTKGLMDCIPKLSDNKEELDSIRGNVESVYEYGEGCRFAPRCPRAKDDCSLNTPPLKELGGGHKCRCYYPL